MSWIDERKELDCRDRKRRYKGGRIGKRDGGVSWNVRRERRWRMGFCDIREKIEKHKIKL